MNNSQQPEGSHVHWPVGYEEVSSADEEATSAINRQAGKAKDRSSSWSVRLPNDRFVADEAVTLEHMRKVGAV